MAALPQLTEQSNWHDPVSVAYLEDVRRRKYAKRWKPKDDEFVMEGRSFEEERDRKYDRKHPKSKGRPELSTPRVYSESGELSPMVAMRISSQRQSISETLLHGHGLRGKARRAACCKVFGRRTDCIDHPGEHRFYVLLRCGLRYCPDGCGELAFSKLFHKHIRLAQIVELLLARAGEVHGSAVIAKIDFTCRKGGFMPTAGKIREFNEDIRKFFRAVEKRFRISRKRGAEHYGAMWCDEFGGGNNNLHAHGLYVGPHLRKKRIVAIWRSIRRDHSLDISIETAPSFERALQHCLKYPRKFSNASGRRLADLEKAFHRVRRVHAVAAFYNPKVDKAEREPGEEMGGCPECHAPLGESLSTKKGWEFFDVLQKEGRRELETARVKANAARIFDPACPFLQAAEEGSSP